MDTNTKPNLSKIAQIYQVAQIYLLMEVALVSLDKSRWQMGGAVVLICLTNLSYFWSFQCF